MFKKGFTLVELLIVVALIGILVTGALSSYRLTQKSSRDGKRKTDMERVRQALELYRDETGSYPTIGGGSWTAFSGLSVLVPDYIDKLPQDPQSTYPYRYRATNVTGARYYGYCMGGKLEASTPTDNPCTPETNYNFTVRNP